MSVTASSYSLTEFVIVNGEIQPYDRQEMASAMSNNEDVNKKRNLRFNKRQNENGTETAVKTQNAAMSSKYKRSPVFKR